MIPPKSLLAMAVLVVGVAAACGGGATSPSLDIGSEGMPRPDDATDMGSYDTFLELAESDTLSDKASPDEPEPPDSDGSGLPELPDWSDLTPLPDSSLDAWADLPAPPDSGPDSLEDSVGDVAQDTETVEPPPTGECLSKNPKPWSRSLSPVGGICVFTEIMYQPAAGMPATWVELFNPLSIDLDLSDWRMEGAVEYAFPDGTFVPPGGYVVVSSDPAALAEAGVPGTLGPWTGKLPPEGGQLDLVNNSGRLMDRVKWTAAEPWPVTAAGSGATLAKAVPPASSEMAESWRGSGAVRGTPGAANFADPLEPPKWVTLIPQDADWTYDASGVAVPPDWPEMGFDDSSWLVGTAAFFAGTIPVLDQEVTAHFTADNFFSIYAGPADGSALTFIARDAVGDWSTVEDFTFAVDSGDHLFVAAWEAVEGDQGPQMLIGEVATPNSIISTTAAGYEWIMGPPNASPGGSLSAPPPSVEVLQGLIAQANAAAVWAAPAVEADKGSDPWAWAVSGEFLAPTHYIWSDTFASLSQSNVQKTYVLFRTKAPVLPPPGQTELPAEPVTTYFRHEFTLPADPSQIVLWLDALVDDGAVFYLNGTEVLSLNMPEGPVGPDTFAALPVETPETSKANPLPSDLLVPGVNVLAVEVHQAAPGGGTMAFSAKLSAQVWPLQLAADLPGPRLNEVSAGGGKVWVEIINTADTDLDVGGMVLATSGGSEVLLPSAMIPAGEIKLFPKSQLGLTAQPGEILWLYLAEKEFVVDGVAIGADPRARLDGTGGWFFPGIPTPGSSNPPPALAPVVINEIMYRHASLPAEDGTPQSSDEEWIELFNAGADTVDLSGWSLVDGVEFAFPEGTQLSPGGFLVVAESADALAVLHPGIPVIGDFKGRLANSGERLALLDSCGNLVDEVRYRDGGRWPQWADGGGSSMELRSPLADNSVPEAWASSIESGASAWEQVLIEGAVSASSVGPDGVWQELVLGLLEEGIVLLDDISLVEDPAGAALERIQNGNFESGTAQGWRLLGNHRHSQVIVDPGNPGNHVLSFVSTGTAEHMHNHVETTLAGGAKITNGVTWRLSFKARWMAGSNQLNSRLYFNRLPVTTLLKRPSDNGTPGAANSVLETNIGPTYRGFSHSPAVPAPLEPVTVKVEVSDPDGVDTLALWYSVDGGEPAHVPMEPAGELFQGQIPGAPDGAIVQFWVAGTDGAGASSFFPAGGFESRALYKVDATPETDAGMHTLRIIVTKADDEWLFTSQNLMSNDRLGCTVIWDEREAFYDVGVRLKGSERGRPVTARVGFSLDFAADGPFHGVFPAVMVDRSEGVGFGQREMLVNLMMARAGTVTAEYSDLIKVIAPRDKHTGGAELQLTRFENEMLDAQFDNGSEGPMYEYEYIYYPTTTTDGNPQSPKLPQPDNVVGSSIKSLGNDKEAYRHIFQLKNNRWRDDYDDLIAWAQFFGSTSNPDFNAQVGAYIDVDQWLRSFALATLPGAVDHFTNGDGHNAVFYFRPSDNRVLYFPHDLDFFSGSPTGSIVKNKELTKLIASPTNSRIFYGHLYDILMTAYNGDYMGHWCDQMGKLLPAQNFAGHLTFIKDRAAWALSGAPDSVLKAIPEVPFEMTTNGGADLSIDAALVVLEGTGWVNVRRVWVAGDPIPLALTWSDAVHWSASVFLGCGANLIELEARNHQGLVVATDSILINRIGCE